MKHKKYITTPIYYVNGAPHVGHAHTSVMADILRRDYIMQGNDVYLTTGVDEHGQKNQKAIAESGLTPMGFLDGQAKVFAGLADKLDVKYDKFVRTTSDYHKKAVQHMLQVVYDKGLIVKKEYTGLYCEGCEMFKTKSDLDENGLCVDHQVKPVETTESNYFFKLSEYQQWLIDYLTEHEDWIEPAQYRTEVLNLLKEPLPDLCISRTKERVWLGIEIPFDTNFVSYVWFDALINYVSSLGYPDDLQNVEQWWQDSTHLMAKDIVKTHCIYWPIMLKAADLPVPAHFFVHGYWTGEGGIKMSKSIGNVVNPYEMLDLVGVDAFRFFLARTMGKNESPMSRALIVGCYNSDLVNVISNGFYRTLKLAEKKYGHVFPTEVTYREEDTAFLQGVLDDVKGFFDGNVTLASVFDQAKLIVEIGRRINNFFDKSAPWTLAKSPDTMGDFNSVIMTCLEAIRLMFQLAYPIMPSTAEGVMKVLGVSIDTENYAPVLRALTLGGTIGDYAVIFQRLDA